MYKVWSGCPLGVRLYNRFSNCDIELYEKLLFPLSFRDTQFKASVERYHTSVKTRNGKFNAQKAALLEQS